MSTNWVERWHGARFSTHSMAFNPGTGGGSTTASTGVTLALSSKADINHGHSSLAALTHTHALSDVTGLTSTLANLASQISTKAAGSHTHTTAEVTGLDSTLANLAAQISTKAAGTHTHAIADVTNLQTTLDNKSDSTHTHAPGGGLAGAIPSTWATLSTHALTGSTVMQNASINLALSSAAMYRFEYVLACVSSAVGTGIALGLNGPANTLTLAYEWGVSTGVGGMIVKTNRAFNVQTVATPAVDSASAEHYGYIGGIVRTGATAGTLQPQFASEVAGSTVSLRAGSVGLLYGPL